jgi:hypothetical protein
VAPEGQAGPDPGKHIYIGKLVFLLHQTLPPSINFPSSVPIAQASISPTHAAAQHSKNQSDQRVKPWWKNRPTLKLWRESPDSERKSPTIPPPHPQGFWQKARKCSEISKLA